MYSYVTSIYCTAKKLTSVSWRLIALLSTGALSEFAIANVSSQEGEEHHDQVEIFASESNNITMMRMAKQMSTRFRSIQKVLLVNTERELT